MLDRMLAGELYIADDPVLELESQRAMALVEAINRSPASEPALRRRLFAELLGTYGEGAEIRPPFFCEGVVRARVSVRRCFVDPTGYASPAQRAG